MLMRTLGRGLPYLVILLIVVSCTTGQLTTSQQTQAGNAVVTLPANEAVATETQPEPTKAAAVLVATATPPAEPGVDATTEVIDWLSTVTVDGDYYILGNPNAPIRLIDYSDFL